MARLNTRPSNNPRARFASETPEPASGQENRDPTSMASRAKGKQPASRPNPRPNSRPSSRAASLSGLSTTSSVDNSNGSGQKRKRGPGSVGTIDEEDEQDDEFYKYFDPNQNAEERRALKRRSRALERDFQENRDEYLNNEGDELVETVLKANDIFKGIKQTGDAMSDSRLLVNVSDLGNKKASRLGQGDSSLRVDLDELVSKCITFMRNRGALNSQENHRPSASRNRRPTQRNEDDEEDDEAAAEPLDWAFFGQNACFPFTSRPPLPNFLLGPLSVQKKVRAATQRRTRNAKNSQGREARPETMTKEDMSSTEDNGLVKICINIWEILKRHTIVAERGLEAAGMGSANDMKTDWGKQLLKEQRITADGSVPLFDFVINPHSFGQTVENLFYVSFLIKDGKVSVDFDEDGLPAIAALEKPNENDKKTAKEGKAHQAIFEMDYIIFEQLKQAYDIHEPIIPHRDDAVTQIGRGWYT